MAESNTEFKCSKPGCEVSTTGSCIEGHDPIEACPTFGHDITTLAKEIGGDVVGDRIDIEEQTPERVTDLPPGGTLDMDDVDNFLRWRPASIITIIGDRDSGKTTLIASIYNRFLREPFAGTIFAGSRSLLALEKLCHLSRVESELETPKTERTSGQDGLMFYHFATTKEDDITNRSDIMFSDRAGETYKRARNNSDLVEGLIEIERSDRIVLLLDGARVADMAERSGAIQSIRQMLRALIDGEVLGVKSTVQIVTTKIDLLASHPQKEAIDRQLNNFKEKLSQDFKDRLESLSFWSIAARPVGGNLGPAHGVDQLYANWSTQILPKAPRSLIDMDLESEFDRLLLRTQMEVLP